MLRQGLMFSLVAIAFGFLTAIVAGCAGYFEINRVPRPADTKLLAPVRPHYSPGGTYYPAPAYGGPRPRPEMPCTGRYCNLGERG
jgi:hypothetical protein